MPTVLSEMDESARSSAIVFEQICQQPWQPTLTSFPALADHGLVTEEFRSLRSRLYHSRYEAPLKTILISSSSPAEGKSFIASNLAVSLAVSSVDRTLLIDGDLRRPTLHNLLGMRNSPGLSDFLSGTADLDAVIQRRETVHQAATAPLSNIAVIPAGTAGKNSPELLANHRFEELIGAVSPYFDWIVIDSPPVLAVTDALELARAADAVLLVARSGRTHFEDAQRAIAAFNSTRLLGFVLNDFRGHGRRSSYGYYYETHDVERTAKEAK